MNVDAIEKIVKNEINFSGVIQIEQEGRKILNHSAGFAKLEDEILNRPDTAFGIASGTKGFTALGVLRQVDQGKLSLEDQVFELLPFDFPNMDKRVTVRQLLNHTSGIYDYFDESVVDSFERIFEKVPIQKILGPKDMLPLLIEGNSYFAPGEKFKYCNSGFVVLGILLETLSGKNYGSYMQKEVCEPLGLVSTGCYKTNQLPKNCAYGYTIDKSGSLSANLFDIPIACTADGGIFTTADDMATMWKSLVSGRFLSKNLVTEVFTPQSREPSYGLGFWIRSSNDSTSKGYSLVGADPGVSFTSTYCVDEDRIVTILGNTSDSAELLFEDISPYLD